MLDALLNLPLRETALAIVIAIAAFATVLTVAAPFTEGDALKRRMKLIESERGRLRAGQRAQLADGSASRRR